VADLTGSPTLLELANALPEHLRLGVDLARGQGAPRRSEIDTILVLGMGTGRTAGQVVRAVAARTIPVPILVENSYEIPGCIGERSLVLAVSGSGDTDEVNHAAAASAERGARIAVVSTRGWLLDFGEAYGATVIRIPQEIQPARATFGVVIGALLGLLEEAGFLPEAREWIESAVAQLDRRRKNLSEKDNIAECLAGNLVCRHVLCQGDTPLGATAAERWKAQINQNARQAASASEQPNASHNEVAAWDSRNDLTMERDATVLLRHDYEDPRVSQRMDRLADYLQGKVPVHSVHGEGGTPFAVLMDLMMIGDVTSFHLADLNGIEPGPVPFIAETVKAGLTPPRVWKERSKTPRS
jgi:glucose/mannose-6-phosphate isomerase